MSDHASWIDRRVVAKTGPGEVYAEGRVVSYTAAPTFTIETDTGARVHWRADLTELVIDEAQVQAVRDNVLTVLADHDYNDGAGMRWSSGEATEQARKVADRIARRLVEQGWQQGGEPR